MCYTPEFDQLLFYLPLAGSAFKKVYYDEVLERAVSKFIPAEDLVIPYYANFCLSNSQCGDLAPNKGLLV